ncbi:peptidase [Eubacteriales bacterium]|nr:membrane dipeptidase [Faecalicatena sp. BF-R-105]GKH49137.1 peptidase [Eubacteriales bacterium]GKH61778.1 peptidase [Eubacteriales bacterium]SFJ48246.1 membrane dipeptidase [Ruminococcaceae bacterium D5]
MRPYALIDLHCDTLTDCKYAAGNPDTLDDPKRVLSLSAIPDDVHWAQFFAIFIPDEERGRAAIDYFGQNHRNFVRQMKRFSDRVSPCRGLGDMEAAFAQSKTAAFLTVENGSVLAGDLSRVRVLAEAGVCAITLVWNGENEIGSGHGTGHGLSAFGRAVIPEMERCGILVDVSHLNDPGFEDLLEVAQKPFLATHSNARAVAGHRRNLTDEMIREMVRRGCLIGLNYFVSFLRDGGEVTSLDDLYRHIVHFLELGASKNLALGSDFDGAALPDCLNTPQKAAEAYGYLLARGIGQKQADGIFYQNARRFFAENLA